MSEYQYYEFLAVDRPLDDQQLAEVRALSTRALITPTRFVNEYERGDFSGDPHTLMTRHYDAHLYVAAWGTRQLMLRVPKRLLALDSVAPYCRDDSVGAWGKDGQVIVDLRSEDEEGDWTAGAEDSLAAIVGVRAELVSGDHRALYLGWLSGLSAWELQDDEEEAYRSEYEPPVPPGLSDLTAPQRALADFLRVDPDLLAVAAESTAPYGPEGRRSAARLLDAAADRRMDRRRRDRGLAVG